MYICIDVFMSVCMYVYMVDLQHAASRSMGISYVNSNKSDRFNLLQAHTYTHIQQCTYKCVYVCVCVCACVCERTCKREMIMLCAIPLQVTRIVCIPGVVSGICLSLPCKNGGTCRVEGSSYKCSCITNTSGRTCERKYCFLLIFVAIRLFSGGRSRPNCQPITLS